MRAMIGAEFCKIWKRRSFLGLLAALVLVNVFGLWFTQRPGPDQAPAEAYRTMGETLRDLSAQERVERIAGDYEKAAAFSLIEQIKVLQAAQGEAADGMIEFLKKEQPGLYETYIGQYEDGYTPKYAPTLPQELSFLKELHQEAKLIAGYPSFLEEVSQKAGVLSGISIFSQSSNSFADRNIQITARDYAAMQGTSVVFDLSKGFVSATGFFASDIIALFLLFAVAAGLLSEEKERGLFALVCSTPRGRFETISAKVLCLAVSIGVITVLLFGANLIYAQCTFGLGDLTRPIQSIGILRQSTLALSLWQYLLFFLTAKWLSYLTVGLAIFLLCLFVRHAGAAYFAFAGLFATEFALYLLIPATSNANLLKHLNLVAFLRVNEQYGGYLNLNVMGYPIQLRSASLFCCVLLALLLTGLLLFFFCTKHRQRFCTSSFTSSQGLRRLPHLRPACRPLGHEAYKLLIVHRVLLVVSVFLLFTVSVWKDYSYYFTPQEYYYRNYMQTLSGELTDEKLSFLEEERLKIADAQTGADRINHMLNTGEISRIQAAALLSPFEKKLALQDVLSTVQERCAYLQAHPGTRFIYDTGYRSLFGLTGNDAQTGLLLIVCCILSFSAIFSAEYQSGAAGLLAATPRGRSATAARKLGLCAAVTVVLSAAAFLPRFLSVVKEFGLPELGAPVSSLPDYEAFPAWLTVGGFLIFFSALRFAGCLCASLMIAALSLRTKNTVLTLVSGGLLLAAPLLLAGIGIPFFYSLSLSPLLENGYSLSVSPLQCLLTATFWLAAGGFCAGYCLNRFGQPAFTR